MKAPADIERRAVSLVANVAPWLAPIPTAWLVYDRTVKYLGWPWWVGVSAGLTLECLGVAIFYTALTLYDYNLTKRKTDPKASTVLPWALGAMYFVSAELLSAFLDIGPKLASSNRTTLADWSAVVFPVLSVAAFVLLALRAGHERRLTAIEQDKAERRASRTVPERKAERPERKPERPEPIGEQEPNDSKPFKCDRCSAAYATQAELSGHGNKHRQKGVAT